MGTTLSNGVYLPDEGERNCYAGLKVNWEILNQKVADISALQSAIAGALHREIVESLPTTDIDPNTIYMILSGTSATENVYDEYMYINNAWELIGTSATDLTNYYTKGDVDGLLLLKANASDLTSHTGDTTIHVTASDKTKWTNSANTHVLRLALSALTPSTSDNSFSNLDDSTALKVGDKVMDTAGVLFEVTAIDTQNSTFTIGTALVDLAQDSDVVHKTGDETSTGFKQFANIRANNSIKGINLDSTTTDLDNCYSDFAPYAESKGGNIQYYYCNTDTGTANISNLPESRAFFLTSITTRLISNSLYVKQILINSNSKTFTRYCANSTWSSWVNETDSEYVHKSGNETVAGFKTFSSTLRLTAYPSIRMYMSDDEWDVQPAEVKQSEIRFTDKNSVTVSYFVFQHRPSSTEPFRTCWRQQKMDGTSGYYSIDFNNLGNFYPENDNAIDLGGQSNKWKSVYATNYYYGNDNIEFSTKFVTTDTNQTISGKKTFGNGTLIVDNGVGSNVHGEIKLSGSRPGYIVADNTADGVFNSAGCGISILLQDAGKPLHIGGYKVDSNGRVFADNTNKNPVLSISSSVVKTSVLVPENDTINSVFRILSELNYANGNPSKTLDVRFIQYDDANATSAIYSNDDGKTSLGASSRKWSDVLTYKVNGVEPSSLSLPNYISRIDISGYVTNLNGIYNAYTPSVDGWIAIQSSDATFIRIADTGSGGLGNTVTSKTAGILTCMMPVRANRQSNIYIVCTTLTSAYFIPCQGNV